MTIFSVNLGTTYLAESVEKKFKKISLIVQWNPWIISKSVIRRMNSSKNKLKSTISYNFKHFPNAHLVYVGIIKWI